MTNAKPLKSTANDACERALNPWQRQQAAPAYDSYCADPLRGLSLEEVRASIDKR